MSLDAIVRYTAKQVPSNKDASEGRDEDRMAERDLPDLPDLIAVCLLQIICRHIAGYLQVSCRLFTVFLLFSSDGTVFISYLGFHRHFHSISA